MKGQKVISRFLTLFLVVVVLCLLSGVMVGQTQQADSQTLKNLPFLELVDLKVSLTSEIAGLEQAIKEMPSKIQDAEQRDRKLSELIAAQKVLNDQRVKTADNKTALATLTRDINILKDQIGDKTGASYKADLQVAQKDLDNKKIMMQDVRKALASIYTPEQEFKRTMSITFAVLIGLVIIGFFYLSYVDAAIRRAIFSGETGIQFLTLFSLVIAIILFGITSILQDKELAALLGGLSGYILGRYNKPNDNERIPLADPNAAHENVDPGNAAAVQAVG
jgi:hypothetical protein